MFTFSQILLFILQPIQTAQVYCAQNWSRRCQKRSIHLFFLLHCRIYSLIKTLCRQTTYINYTFLRSTPLTSQPPFYTIPINKV